MDFNGYLKQLKNIQENIVAFINNKIGVEDDSINLTFLKEQKFDTNKYLLKETLLLLLSMSNNHHHSNFFFDKIFRILSELKEAMRMNLSNYDIFNIFKSNKRIVLFLFDENIVVPDETITNILSECKYFTCNYPEYFFAEIGSKRLDKLPFYKTIGENYWVSSVPSFPIIEYSTFYETLFKDHQCDVVNGDEYDKNSSFKVPQSSDDLKHFEQKRRTGENEDIIAYIIRNDSIDDFKLHISKKIIKFNSVIKPSIYETNAFLINKSLTLLQYSMFWGSMQIIKYLCDNNVELDSSLWIYAIHSKNPDLIRFLEEKNVKPENGGYLQLYLEAIKCHHNSIAYYIKDKYLKRPTKSEESQIMKCVLKNHNYFHFKNDFFTSIDYFYEFCKYDYYLIVDSLLQNPKLDVNKVKKYKKIIQSEFDCSNTALTAAVSQNNFEIVELLLSHPTIDVNSKWIQEIDQKKDNFHFKTIKNSLIISVEKENINMTNLLLSHPKIDINAEKTLKHNFLSYSFEESKTPISLSIFKRNFKLFQLLLKQPKIDVNQKIALGCNLSQYNKHDRKESPLILTIDFQLNDYFQLLLQHQNIDVNTISEYKEYGKRDEENPNFDLCEFAAISALNLAIKWKNAKMAKLLINHPKINVNLISNPKGLEETPLLASFKNDSLEIFELLLQHPKIDVNVQMKGDFKYDRTILQFAFQKWNAHIIKLLLARKDIKVNFLIVEDIDMEKVPDHIKDIKTKANEESLLHMATEKDDFEIVRLLLRKKDIDVNFLTSKVIFRRELRKRPYEETINFEIQKKTALVVAAEKNRTEIVRLLMSDPKIDASIQSTITKIERKYTTKLGDNGGGWILKNESRGTINETALSVAQKNGNKQMIDLLKK